MMTGTALAAKYGDLDVEHVENNLYDHEPGVDLFHGDVGTASWWRTPVYEPMIRCGTCRPELMGP